MSNLPDNSINTDLENKTSDPSWWNRPIWGEDSLLEDLMSKLDKATLSVAEQTVMLHRASMMDALVFAKTATAIDSDKFSNQEFLLYFKINYALRRGIDGYEGIGESVQLFEVAIEAQHSYITLDQTEIRYRSSKQQELYEFVRQLLLCQEEEDQDKFRDYVQKKLTEVLSQIKTEEGRNAMQAYVKELDHLAEHPLKLKLLSLFKAYELADYSILRTISDLIAKLKEQDVTDLKILASLVMSQYEVFEKLGQIIGVTEKLNNPNTYALMVQYMALGHRHKLSYIQFEELLTMMQKWYKPYQVIAGIREQYPPKEFKIPKEFSEPIPGLEVYEKYRKSLTDKKTGMSYIDFSAD